MEFIFLIQQLILVIISQKGISCEVLKLLLESHKLLILVDNLLVYFDSHFFTVVLATLILSMFINHFPFNLEIVPMLFNILRVIDDLKSLLAPLVFFSGIQDNVIAECPAHINLHLPVHIVIAELSLQLRVLFLQCGVLRPNNINLFSSLGKGTLCLDQQL